MSSYLDNLSFWEERDATLQDEGGNSDWLYDNLFVEVPPPSAPARVPSPSPARVPSPAPARVPSPSPARVPAPTLDAEGFDPAVWAQDLNPLPEWADMSDAAVPVDEAQAAPMAQDQGTLDAEVLHEDHVEEEQPLWMGNSFLLPNPLPAELIPDLHVQEAYPPQHYGDFLLAVDPQLQHAEVSADQASSHDAGDELDAYLHVELFGSPVPPVDSPVPAADTASSSGSGPEAQERPAPQTASELTGMILPCAPVQYAERNASTLPADGAAEALDTPVQMPAPEPVETPLPSVEEVPVAADLVDAPAPTTPGSIDTDIYSAPQDQPAVEARADGFMAQLDGRNNRPVPAASNVSIPQNNMWDGQGMQPQMNGMFHPSIAGNMYIPRAYPNGMAQGGLNPMAMNAHMQHPYAAGFNPSLPSNMPIFGMHPAALHFAQPGVQAWNPLNPNWGIQNGHPIAQSQPQLNGYIHQAGQPVMLNAPAQQRAPQFFGLAGNTAAPNGIGHTQAQAPALNTNAQMPMVNGMFQHQAAQSFGQAGFVNGAMNANAQGPVLNVPRQMAPANQMVNGMGQHQPFQPFGQAAPAPVLNAPAPMNNGRVQFPTAESPELYRKFSQRPSSKPGHQLLAFCIGCKAHMKQFGVRCANCQHMHRHAPNVRARSCIVCTRMLEPGTNRIFCDEHHLGKYQYTEGEKATFKAEGICNNCYKVEAEDCVTCQGCRAGKNAGYQARSEEAKSKGICQTCRQPNPSDCKKCDGCREEENAKRRKRPSPEKEDGTGTQGKRPRKA